MPSRWIAELGPSDRLAVRWQDNATVAAEAVEVCRQLNPTITIPMHYRTPALGLMGLMFARVDKFLALASGPAREMLELSVDQASLAENAGIIVMKYKQ